MLECVGEVPDQELLVHQRHCRDRAGHHPFEGVFHGGGVFQPGVPVQRADVQLCCSVCRGGRGAKVSNPFPERPVVRHRPELVSKVGDSGIPAAGRQMNDEIGEHIRQLELKVVRRIFTAGR